MSLGHEIVPRVKRAKILFRSHLCAGAYNSSREEPQKVRVNPPTEFIRQQTQVSALSE